MEEETPETTTASTSSTTTNEGEPQSDEHPWPYLSAMFSYSDVKDSSYRMKCLLCLPKNVEILSYRNSPSNLKKHIEVSVFYEVYAVQYLYDGYYMDLCGILSVT